MLLVCSHLSKTEAAYRRISYLAKYLRSNRLRVMCAGTLSLTRYGILRPSEECIAVSISVSTRSFAISYLLNVVLSLSLTVLILALRPKIVLVSIPDSYLVLASYFGCALTRARLVVDIRDPQEEIMVWEYRRRLSGLLSRMYRWINYAIYRKSHAVVGVTRSLVAMLARQIGRPVHLAPNGADLEVFKPLDKFIARKRLGLNQNSFLIAYAGGLSSYRYYDLSPLLLAIRRVRKKLGIDAKLVVAGPILDNHIKRVIESFRDELVYLGLLDVKGVVMLLSACDIGAIPRVNDPVYDYALPVKFYEYIAMGLPLIVTANMRSELAKIVHENELGVICERHDVSCLEKALLHFLLDEETIVNLRNNILKFRWMIDREMGAKILFKILNEVVALKG